MDRTLGSRHAISFQSSTVNSSSEMIMMGHYYPMKASNSSGFTQYGLLKHDAALAVEWSAEEQHKLEEGLSIFADEPSIMRYIKIAATLNDKTVRDVALRCRWMARKRKKQDEPHMAKKLKDKKDNLVVSSSKPSTSSVPNLDMAPFPVAMNKRVQIDRITFEALGNSIKHLLEQNNQVLGQISANISSMKLQDNLDLFSHTKNNITAILNDMRYMPGPPFPVSLNEDLAHNIMPPKNQRKMFEAPNGMYVKQEPEF